MMEYIKQDEKNSQENGEGAQHSDHVSQQLLFNFTSLGVGGELDGKNQRINSLNCVTFSCQIWRFWKK